MRSNRLPLVHRTLQSSEKRRSRGFFGRAVEASLRAMRVCTRILRDHGHLRGQLEQREATLAIPKERGGQVGAQWPPDWREGRLAPR